MIGKYFNKMPFSIKMKKVWEPGAPAIEIQPGEIIEGPAEILSQFKILSPMPSDFCEVESITQTQSFEFTEETKAEDIVITSQPDTTTPPQEGTTSPLPFDPHKVNWLHIKVADLEAACKILGVDTTPVNELKPKQKKWELVKLVKTACGIVVK
jgi:hypothetical protein